MCYINLIQNTQDISYKNFLARQTWIKNEIKIQVDLIFAHNFAKFIIQYNHSLLIKV